MQNLSTNDFQRLFTIKQYMLLEVSNVLGCLDSLFENGCRERGNKWEREREKKKWEREREREKIVRNVLYLSFLV